MRRYTSIPTGFREPMHRYTSIPTGFRKPMYRYTSIPTGFRKQMSPNRSIKSISPPFGGGFGRGCKVWERL